jgi:hypothetical protein
MSPVLPYEEVLVRVERGHPNVIDFVLGDRREVRRPLAGESEGFLGLRSARGMRYPIDLKRHRVVAESAAL